VSAPHCEVTMAAESVGIVVTADAGPGILHQLTGVIARRRGDITSLEIIDGRPPESRVYFEIEVPSEATELLAELAAMPVVRKVETVRTFQKIYGKRIIIMGGGAQVGQVAIGAISEADRHNIRGEHVSVDTIPLVGERELADAVRAVTRLPRARALVLAGSLMGGEIEQAVRDVRAQGLLVISLNMAGSVPDAADLVVSDPVQAGVMAVMAVADTAKFSVEKLTRRRF
jgi:energy-converting hydrogenase B subunit Q